VVRDARYVIAVASDSKIPDLSASFYDGDEMLTSVYEEQISRLERTVFEKDRLLSDIENSISFKVGRLVTFPLRLLLSGRKQGR